MLTGFQPKEIRQESSGVALAHHLHPIFLSCSSSGQLRDLSYMSPHSNLKGVLYCFMQNEQKGRSQHIWRIL